MHRQAAGLDWMVTNTPEKYTRAGVTWMGTGADHALVWAERSLQQGLGQRRRTRKRMWKNYTEERLKQEAGKVDWELSNQPHTREGLDSMVEELEGKIKKVMNGVAPMKTVEVKPRKLGWLTAELREGRKKSMELQRKYHSTRKEEDGKIWKEQRREVARELRRAKNNYAKQGLKDKQTHSKSMWQGVKAHLGWEDTGAPTRLVRRTKGEEGGNSSVTTITDPKEIGEEITKAFEEKAKKLRRPWGR